VEGPPGDALVRIDYTQGLAAWSILLDEKSRELAEKNIRSEIMSFCTIIFGYSESLELARINS